MLLSIVMPVFNEQDTLVAIIERVLSVALPIDRELILIDDCSRDETPKLYNSLPQRFPGANIRVVRHPVNRGKGAAVRTGFAQARGDLVLVQDADLEYNPSDYPRLLQPILDGMADVVYGSRFASRETRQVHSFWHTLVNRGLTLLSNMFTDLNLTDMETCYKVFRKEVLAGMTLRSDRFGIEPEITAKVARGRWRVVEVPIRYAGRSYAEGKKITWRDGVRAVVCIVRFALTD
ncbi:MAG: glycosyltransferase family 2 protein [Phycisphaerae bacterium]